MVTTITGAATLILFVCLVVYVAVAAGLRPKALTRRKNALVITLLSLASLAGLGGYLFSSHILSEGKADLYLAVHCLRQGEFDGAHDKLITAVAKDGERFETNALNAMLYVKQRDYASAVQYIEAIEKEQSLTQTQRGLLDRLKVLAPAYVTDPEAGAEEYENLCSALVQFLNLSVSTKTRCDKYYDIEHAVEVLEQTGIQDASVDIGELIGDFKARYPDNADIDYLKIRYHVVNNNYTYAVRSVEELLAESDSLEHRVLYADILLQDLYAGSGSFFPAQSKEAAKYEEKAKKLDEQIASLTTALSGELSDSKRERTQQKVADLTSKKNGYLDRAKQVPAEQILNYLSAKKGFFGDRSGIYRLMGAKAYYGLGNTEEANKYLSDLVDGFRFLSSDSPVRIALGEALGLAADYRDGSNEKLASRFDGTVRLLVRKGGCVSPIAGDTLNAEFAEYLSQYLLQNTMAQEG